MTMKKVACPLNLPAQLLQVFPHPFFQYFSDLAWFVVPVVACQVVEGQDTEEQQNEGAQDLIYESLARIRFPAVGFSQEEPLPDA